MRISTFAESAVRRLAGASFSSFRASCSYCCIEAGTLSTIARLHGAGAESFLDGMGVRYWCIR